LVELGKIIIFHSFHQQMFCGIDEAGRGSVMGPLVVGSVYCESDETLIKIGVKDSKKLTPSSRERMYELIRSEYRTSVVIASAAEIDERRKAMTLNVIELEMFVEAARVTPVSVVYADCPDVNETGFARMMSSRLKDVRIVAKHKADDIFPVVSAASIIAKVTRDRMISDIEEEFGTAIGSGYPSDTVTMEFIEKWIKENGSPPKHTRCSWEPVRQLMTVSKNTKISDW
jgi:ribonuclease H, mammalian HI/archaeal HII subfamily